MNVPRLNMLKTLFIALLVMVSTDAHAQQLAATPLSFHVKELVLSLVNRIQVAPESLQIAGGLQTLKSRIPSIQWYEQAPFVPPASAGTRSSAYFIQGAVVLSPDLKFYSNVDLEFLGLHEALGAMGYDDSSYQISVPLTAMTRTNDALLRTNLSRAVVELSSTRLDPRAGLFTGALGGRMVAFGGGTGVDGGGDLVALAIKMRVLTLLLNQGISYDFFIGYSYVDFEPDYSLLRATPEFGVRGGYLAIIVPVRAWLSGDENYRAQLLWQISQEVIRVYRQNYPAYVAVRCSMAPHDPICVPR